MKLKHAMILTAYNDFEALALLCQYYNKKKCDVYLHIDKKSVIPDSFKKTIAALGG